MVPEDGSIGQRLLRVPAAARYLNLNVKQVRDLVRKREIKAIIRRPGRPVGWLIDIRELDRWIEKHSTTSPGPRRW